MTDLDARMPRREITLHLGDEIPKLRQGRRKVVVWSIGLREVILRRPGSDKNITVRRTVWDKLLAAKHNKDAMNEPDQPRELCPGGSLPPAGQ